MLFTVEVERKKDKERQTVVFLIDSLDNAHAILAKIRGKKTKVLRAWVTLSYDQIGRKASE